MLSIYLDESKDGGSMRSKKSIIYILAILIIGGVIAIIINSLDSKTKLLKEETTTNQQNMNNTDTLSNEIISEIEENKDTDIVNDIDSNKDSKTENSNKMQESELFGKLIEKPIIENGKRVATYAEVIINNKTKFTDKNIIEFYEDTVKNSKYKWVTLRISKNKGIQFNNGTHIFNYGILNDNGQVTDVLGSGNVMLDKIEYQGR